MNNLQLGIAAYKKGEIEEAEKYFRAALSENLDDERAWGWLYQVSDNPEIREHCLKNMLRINPANEKARQELNKIQPKKLAPPPVKKYYVPTNPEKKSDPNQLRNLLIGIGAILTLFCICIGALWFYDPPTGPRDHKTMAYIQCRLHVEDRLKSPSSAEFPSASVADIQDVGNNVFEIRSYVDAQNSFGAMIRTNYFCKIQYTGTEQHSDSDSRYWTLLQLDLFE